MHVAIVVKHIEKILIAYNVKGVLLMGTEEKYEFYYAQLDENGEVDENNINPLDGSLKVESIQVNISNDNL